MIKLKEKESPLYNEVASEINREYWNNPQSRYILIVSEKDRLKTRALDIKGTKERDRLFYLSEEQLDLTGRSICEAADCKREATERIEVNVGKMEPICLHVCSDCVKKFED